MNPGTKFRTVTEYLAAVPAASRPMAKSLRKLIKDAAPDAEELITYNMPGYKLNGFLVSFAVWKEHIGLYPRTLRMEAAMPQIMKYEGAKGTIKFPLSEPLPITLIKKIIKFRVGENTESAKTKVKKKKAK